MVMLLLAFACTGVAKDDSAPAADADTDTDADTDADADGDTDADTDTDTNTAGCDPVNAGEDWAWHGECPQMTTPCVVEVAGCALTISYPEGMTMGMPYAATVSGSDVTFEDGDSVPGCVGTVVSADKIEGTCADGCTFALRR